MERSSLGGEPVRKGQQQLLSPGARRYGVQISWSFLRVRGLTPRFETEDEKNLNRLSSEGVTDDDSWCLHFGV